MRAARHGLPLMLAIIGGESGAVRARSSTSTTGRSTSSASPQLPVGVHSPGHIADTDEEAREQLWPHYAGACATASAPSAAGGR